VFQSTDGGGHWEERSRGLTDREVHSLVILPSDPSVILAGTLHRGLFRSTDGGGMWVHVTHDSSQVWGLSVRSRGVCVPRLSGDILGCLRRTGASGACDGLGNGAGALLLNGT
jgi:hypothetical protein